MQNNKFLIKSLFSLILSFFISSKPLVSNPIHVNPPDAFEQGVLYVKIKEKTYIPLISNNINKSFNPFWDNAVKTALITSIQSAALIDHPELKRYYRIHFDNFDRTQWLITYLKQSKLFESVERCPIFRPANIIPNDPQFINQTYLFRVKALEAWQISVGKKNVVIAVVDDAFYTEHQDIKDNLWVNTDEIPNNNVDDDSNGFIDDIHGWDVADQDNNVNPTATNSVHGTFVGSIAAGVTNNQKGLASLSYNCTLMPIKGESDKARIGVQRGFEGIQYAIKNKADVINLSWGSYYFFGFGEAVIRIAQQQGIIIVAGAGNNNVTTPFYPANYPGVMAVGSTNQANDQKADYSNFGSWIDVMAPGDMIAAGIGSPDAYVWGAGTSFASPLVAALCGLVLSYNPDLTPAQVQAIIKNTADNIYPENSITLRGQLGAGRINALNALKNAFVGGCEPIISKNLLAEPAAHRIQTGFLLGANSRNHSGFAERFTKPKGYDNLEQIELYYKGNLKGSILTIWDINEYNSLPDRSLFRFIFPDSIFNGNQPLKLKIPQNLTLPDSFFIGVIFSSFALSNQGCVLSSGLGDSRTPNKLFIKDNNQVWISAKEIFSFDINAALIPTFISKYHTKKINFEVNITNNDTLELSTQIRPHDQCRWLVNRRIINAPDAKLKLSPAENRIEVSLIISNAFCTSRFDTVLFKNNFIGNVVKDNTNSVIIYPNPCHQSIFLTKTPQGEYLITNVFGQNLQYGKIFKNEINVKELPSGVYFFQLIQNQVSTTFKFIKD